MKVALISYNLAEYCIQQANGLARHCEVLLMLPRDDAAEHDGLLDPSVDFRPFDKPRLRQPLRQLRTTANLLRELRRFKPDVVHFQQGHMWFNLALPRLREYPLVLTIHDPRYHVGDRDSQKTPQWIMDFGFRRADHVIVHGESLKQQVSQVIGIKPDRIHVVPHIALGTSQQAPEAASSDGQTILFFGRIWDYKGLKYLIEAEPMIAAAVPNARIVIAGTGDDFGQYRRMMARPERFVVHDRFVPASERDELFRQASMVVLPYIEATQSGVVPLAYAFSKPVVATKVGALGEAVEDGVTGRLVPPRDSKSLAAAIIDLLNNPVRGRKMGAAGRQKLETEWSPEPIAQQTMKVYRQAISDRTGSVRSYDFISPTPLAVKAPLVAEPRVSALETVD